MSKRDSHSLSPPLQPPLPGYSDAGSAQYNNNNDEAEQQQQDYFNSTHKDNIISKVQRQRRHPPPHPHSRHLSDPLDSAAMMATGINRSAANGIANNPNNNKTSTSGLTSGILRPPTHNRHNSNGSHSYGNQYNTRQQQERRALTSGDSYQSNADVGDRRGEGGGNSSMYSSLEKNSMGISTITYSTSQYHDERKKSTTNHIRRGSSFSSTTSTPSPSTWGSSKHHRKKLSQDSHVSWDASTLDTYSRASRASTRRTIESRGGGGGGSTTSQRSVSFHPSVTVLDENGEVGDGSVNDIVVRHRYDPAPPTFWIWLAIVLSSILWFLASQGKVRGELHYHLYPGQTWQLPTPRLLADKYFVKSLADYGTTQSTTAGVEIYQLRWCPPTTGPTLTVQRNSTITLHKDGGGNGLSFQYDYFRLNAGSALELQATQLQGSSAIYLVRGVNVLSYLLENGDYPFEYDNLQSLYLDASSSSSKNTRVSTTVPIRNSDAFILFYAAGDGAGSSNNINNDVSMLDVRVTLRAENHALPSDAEPVCTTQDTSSGNCNWFSKQRMARLKVNCIIAKVVLLSASSSSTRTVLDEGSNHTITDDTDGVDETNERKKSTMVEFQSTSSATTNRKVFVTVSGTLTILVAVFLCCRSLQRKTHPDYDNQNQKQHRRHHAKNKNNRLPNDAEDEEGRGGEMAPLMTNDHH